MRASFRFPGAIGAVAMLLLPATLNAQTAPTITVAKSIDQIRIAMGTDPKCGTATDVVLTITPHDFTSTGAGTEVTLVTGGRMSLDDNIFHWDLTGVQPGTYLAMLKTTGDNGESATANVPIEVVTC